MSDYNKKLLDALNAGDEKIIIEEIRPLVIKEARTAGAVAEDIQQELFIELLTKYRSSKSTFEQRYLKYRTKIIHSK